MSGLPHIEAPPSRDLGQTRAVSFGRSKEHHQPTHPDFRVGWNLSTRGLSPPLRFNHLHRFTTLVSGRRSDRRSIRSTTAASRPTRRLVSGSKRSPTRQLPPTDPDPSAACRSPNPLCFDPKGQGLTEGGLVFTLGGKVHVLLLGLNALAR